MVRNLGRCWFGLALALNACGLSEAELDSEADDETEASGALSIDVAEGSPDAVGMLRVANEGTQALFIDEVRLRVRTASNILSWRAGSDGILGNTDDRAFRTLAELDAVPNVNKKELTKILKFAREKGYVPSCVKQTIATPKFEVCIVGQSKSGDFQTCTGEVIHLSTLGSNPTRCATLSRQSLICSDGKVAAPFRYTIDQGLLKVTALTSSGTARTQLANSDAVVASTVTEVNCPSDPACNDVICDKPPATTCGGYNEVLTYSAETGYCAKAVCIYPAVSHPCEDGCSSGVCMTWRHGLPTGHILKEVPLTGTCQSQSCYIEYRYGPGGHVVANKVCATGGGTERADPRTYVIQGSNPGTISVQVAGQTQSFPLSVNGDYFRQTEPFTTQTTWSGRLSGLTLHATWSLSSRTHDAHYGWFESQTNTCTYSGPLQ